MSLIYCLENDDAIRNLILYTLNAAGFEGRGFDRETLLREIWDAEYAGETRTVDVHVRSLRAKLGSAADCIETVRGRGPGPAG